MTRKWIITALAVAGIAPAGLGAQQTPRSREAPRSYTLTVDGNRARIGVLVNREANQETDKIGAKLDAVTPGGPADKAGLKAGDIITKFNGTSLAGLSGEDDEDSGPGAKLVDLVGDLNPGDTVKVEYRRGSDTRTATLITDEQGYAWSGQLPSVREFDRLPSVSLDVPRMSMPLMVGPDQSGFSFCFGDAWCDLDLVTLNSDLGDYFGTKEGVLVIKAPGDTALPLKSGDVILSIGGRKPTSPAHAMRILRSYDVGETVSIEIMRHQRRQTLTWTVPEAGMTRHMHPATRPRGEQSLWRAPEAMREWQRVALERQLQEALRAQRLTETVRERTMHSLQQRLDSLRVRLQQRMRSVEI